MLGDVRYIVAGQRFGTIKLTEKEDGFFHDDNGVIFAFRDGASVDPVDRCGVFPFALPTWNFLEPINRACGPHDFAYSSKVYQAFHTRQEADQMLLSLQMLAGHALIGELFSQIAEHHGAGYWENPATNY